MRELTKKFLARTAMLFVYGALSAWMFYELEKQPVSNAVLSAGILTDAKQRLRGAYNVTESELDNFIASVSKAVLLGKTLDWSFFRALSFVLASLTTIGYGNIIPQRAASQGIFIPFCIIGLPLTMLALKTSGEILAEGYTALIVSFEKRFYKCDAVNSRSLKIKTLVMSFATTLSAIIIMGVIQSFIDDNWTVVEGIYAWGVTLSTIGFGDYVPFDSFEKTIHSEWGENEHVEVIYLAAAVVTLLPILFLLTLVSSCLSAIVDACEILKPKLDVLTFCKCCTRQSRRSTTGIVVEDEQIETDEQCYKEVSRSRRRASQKAIENEQDCQKCKLQTENCSDTTMV